MTGSEPDPGTPSRDEPEALRPTPWRTNAATPGESTPIVWKWWLLAALLSLALWAGIAALVL
jgi:hypothetical protein